MANWLLKATRRPVGWPVLGPVPDFEQHGLEDADVDDLAADAVDLNPVPEPDAVAADQCEPAEEGDDEVLQDHRQSSRGQSDDRGQLAGNAEDDQENQTDADHAYGDLGDDAQLVQAPRIFLAAERPADCPAQKQHAEHDGEERGERTIHEVHHSGAPAARRRRSTGCRHRSNCCVSSMRLSSSACVLRSRRIDGCVPVLPCDRFRVGSPRRPQSAASTERHAGQRVSWPLSAACCRAVFDLLDAIAQG